MDHLTENRITFYSLIAYPSIDVYLEPFLFTLYRLILLEAECPQDPCRSGGAVFRNEVGEKETLNVSTLNERA